MNALDDEARLAALYRLTQELELLLGQQPRGLSEDDLDRAWREAKEYWNMPQQPSRNGA